MTRTMNSFPLTSSVPAIARFGRQEATLVSRLALVFTVWKERQDLAHLDARSLRDMGLTPHDVASESSRTLLDVPANRY
jgi:uncharacterized protein YjiS (DUF1127 family)